MTRESGAFSTNDHRYSDFGPRFFDRADPSRDGAFYAQPRLVTHIDEGAIEAAGRVYESLGVEGTVLDLMSSWISHFATKPNGLVALGRNSAELARNDMAVGGLVADLNDHPELPFVDDAFDHVVCAVSVDYLRRPLEVFDDVARVVRSGGVFCHVFSNRLFPTKAIAGWLHATEEQRVVICAEYFRRSGDGDGSFWTEPEASIVRGQGDPLYAVWARRGG